MYSIQHLKWVKKVNQSCPKTRTHFRTTLMKGFDPLQMLASVYVFIYLFCTFKHVLYQILFIFNWLLMFTTAQWHHWYRRPSWSSTSSAAAGGSCPLAACTASQGQHSVPGTDARACSTTADPATVPAGYSTASASTGAIFLVLLNLLVVLNLRG